MRILIFNWRDMKHPQAGGAELYLHEQAKYWCDWGCRVDWICSRFPGMPRHEDVDGIQIHRCGNRFSVYFKAFSQYRKLQRPDLIIDAENGIPFFTPLYTHVPTILLIHHIHTEVWSQEYKWMLARCGNYLESRAMPQFYKGKPIVTVSESSRKMVKQLFPASQPEIVPNAVSSRLEPGEKSPSPEIIFVGRLKRYKSVDVLLKAMERLSSLDIVLNIVGRGDDEQRLRQMAAQLKLDNVNFFGFVDEEEKRRLLQRAWIMVNPSMIEGWGITNIEANACGTPALGADVPGIRDSILDNQSGLLFEYGNDRQLAEKIAQLIKHPDELKHLSQAALEWAGNFSWEQSAKKMQGIFEQLTKKKYK